jgi:large subunit ribosomal protein L17
MRHKMNQSKLSRPTDERLALVHNQVASLFEHGYLNTTLPRARAVRSSLFEHGYLNTTLPRARAVRSLAERLITRAKRGDLASIRECAKVLPTKTQLRALLRNVVPAQADVTSGYTQIAKLGLRRGDGALVVRLSLRKYQTEASPKPVVAGKARPAAAQQPEAGVKPAAKKAPAK